MKPPIFRRLYRAVFLVSFIIMLLSLLAFEFFENDIDDTILELELTGELAHFKNRIEGAGFQAWRTDRLEVFFSPKGQSNAVLPVYLQDLPATFSGEIEPDGKTYLVLSEPLGNPEGRLIVAQNISVREAREDAQEALTQGTLVLIAIIMALIGLVLSGLVARRLVSPLKTLTHDIQAMEPGKTLGRLSVDFDDMEFEEIAKAFNRFLEALEMFVEREKSFVKLASHELRTPVAVMTGALDVIESRENLSEANRRTIARMRRAALDMQYDVEVLLALVRGRSDERSWENVSLLESIGHAMDDMRDIRPEYAGRLCLTSPDDYDFLVYADPALIRMLIRNLLQNALKHTKASVEIWVCESGFGVRDFGGGLPETVQARLETPRGEQNGALQEPSFGLLIVQLICEKLNAKLRIRAPEGEGTEILVAL